MKNNSVRTIVAIGIGAALFFVLGRFVAIPSGVPNTNISIQYGALAFIAAVYGPIAGLLSGLIGHFFIDFSYTVCACTESHFEPLTHGCNHIANTPEIFTPRIKQHSSKSNQANN